MSENGAPSFQTVQAPKASAASVWSLILGILSMTCLWIFGSIPAIILGFKGIKNANADPQNVGGKGISIGGLICGSVGIFVGLIPVGMVAAMILPAFQGVRDKALVQSEINNMRQTALALNIYAVDHDGKFPERLDDLMPDYIDTDDIFHSPSRPNGDREKFQYRPGLTSSSVNEPVLLSPVVHLRQKQIVGWADGRVVETGPLELADIIPLFNP